MNNITDTQRIDWLEEYWSEGLDWLDEQPRTKTLRETIDESLCLSPDNQKHEESL